MNRFIVLSGLIILVFLASLSLAGIPKLINYQGMLTGSDGTTPVTNGNYPILFSIYNTSSGGSALWSHTYNVPVTNGLFNIILGDSGAPINLPFDTTYWLGIKVGGDPELSPRIRLTSVGYAYRADTAGYALAGPWGGNNSWIFLISDGADTTLRTGGAWGIARYGNTLYGNADSTHVNLGVACTTGTSGQNYKYCTVGGGYKNTASGHSAAIAGGRENAASHYSATVGGGWQNTASGDYASVGGGGTNTASGFGATVGGGVNNTVNGLDAIVGGGSENIASGAYSTVGGGYDNTASGNYSFAAGRKATAQHTGTFVWADTSVDYSFFSTGHNQFLIRASGGVGIGTNNPEEMLHVQGTAEGVVKVGASEGDGNAVIIFEEGDDDALALRYVGTANELRIDDETQDSTRMVIERSGKVGIGTASPQEKLHVWWGTNVDAELGRGGSDTDITYLALRNANGTKCYIYPNAAGNGIVVSTTKP